MKNELELHNIIMEIVPATARIYLDNRNLTDLQYDITSIRLDVVELDLGTTISR